MLNATGMGSWLTAAALIAAIATVAWAQGTHPVSGRRIANVMGHQGAAWLERPEREAEEAPSKAIAALNIKPGQIVADIGAGSGYYSVLLADAAERPDASTRPTSSRRCWR